MKLKYKTIECVIYFLNWLAMSCPPLRFSVGRLFYRPNIIGCQANSDSIVKLKRLASECSLEKYFFLGSPESSSEQKGNAQRHFRFYIMDISFFWPDQFRFCHIKCDGSLVAYSDFIISYLILIESLEWNNK